MQTPPNDLGTEGGMVPVSSGRTASALSPLASALSQMVQITGFTQCVEVYRSPKFGQNQKRDKAVIGGTVNDIDGHEHRARRRALNRLTMRNGHLWFRDNALMPAISRVFADVRAARASDGIARADLYVLARRAQVQGAAGIIGLKGIDSPEAVDQLLEVASGITPALNPFLGMRDMSGGSDEAVQRTDDAEERFAEQYIGYAPEALQAKERFAEEYFRPAFRSHCEVVDQHVSSGRPVEELPHTLMTLMALKLDPRWESEELALRESIAMLLGIVSSSTDALTFAFDELESWFTSYPHERQRSTDLSLLLRAVQESLRLHTNTPATFKQALEDVVLSDGTTIKAGTTVALRKDLANRDPSVFGPDASQFDPYRTLPEAIQRNGLTFGSGPHLCFGMPLVLGQEGIDGSVVHFLRALYEAEARSDPERPAIRDANDGSFTSYPVLLWGSDRVA